MNDADRESAEHMRARLERASVEPAMLHAAILGVTPLDRDAWIDLAFGLDSPPPDGPELPRGGVPYLPCSVDTVLRMIAEAGVGPTDVFVDIGGGAGRTVALVQLLTGATAIGVEIQPALVAAARTLVTRLHLELVRIVERDAAVATDDLAAGTVFFLYCPFSGERLDTVLETLAVIAQTRELRVCCVDLPLPARPWLVLAAAARELAVYRSIATGPAPSAR